MSDTTFIGGVAFGLASALHCGAMCGGIACGANLLLGAQSNRERAVNLAIMQVGRIASYTAIGAIAAYVGGEMLPARAAASQTVIQWAASISLMWLGLVLAGATPRFSLVDRGMAALAGGTDYLRRKVPRGEITGPLSLGVVWGLNACPMVYGAALFASITGSAQTGATFMMGFGLGTIPAVAASCFGLTLFSQVAKQAEVRVFAGLIIAAAGMAVAYTPLPALLSLCAIR